MKAKITQLDGISKTELEGTPEELATFFRINHPLPVVSIPTVLGSPYYINTPGNASIKLWTCEHEYPNPWLGVSAPACTKCGLQSLIPTTITVSSSGNLP